MRSGAIYRRDAWEPSTSETESSSWPTARSLETGEYQNQRDGSTVQALSGVSQNWPTPNATDDRRGNTGYTEKQLNRPEGAPKILNHEVSQWFTPNTARRGTEDPEKKAARQATAGGGCADLLTQAEYWATPNAMAGGSTSRGGERIGEQLLGGQVSTFMETQSRLFNRELELTPSESESKEQSQPAPSSWPTPTSRDEKNPGTAAAARASAGHAQPLGEVAAHLCSPQVPVTSTDGIELSPTDPSTSERRRLNPAFVCWLMGWPWWWTRAEPISFAAEEMASWRCKLQQCLSSLCAGYQGASCEN